MILDCTLRDGGYYNNWDFSMSFTQKYLKLMEKLKVEFVELGFRSVINDSYKGPFAYTPEFLIKKLEIPERINLGIMINASEFVGKDNLKSFPSILDLDDSIQFVRVASTMEELEVALSLVQVIKSIKPIKVFLNVMKMSLIDSSKLEDFANRPDLNFDVLYFADSFGGVNPSQIADFFHQASLLFNSPLGIHAHDNLGLAFANSNAALLNGATWVDGTLFGMGRGPGNTKTENLWLQDQLTKPTGVDKDSLIELLLFLNMEMRSLKEIYNWGESLEYNLSARLGIHPTYIQSLLEDNLVSTKDKVRAIFEIGTKSPLKFVSADLNSALRADFKSNEKENSDDFKGFGSECVVLVANSESGMQHSLILEDLCKRIKADLIMINRVPNPTWSIEENVLVLTSNPIKVEPLLQELETFPRVKLVLPKQFIESYLGSLDFGKNSVDYALSLGEGQVEIRPQGCSLPDSLSGIYALAYAISQGVNRIFLVGFDGKDMSSEQKETFGSLLNQIVSLQEGIELTALTPSFLNIPTKSIYGSLIND